MYSYNLTAEQIDNMSLEELKWWKNFIAMNIYNYCDRDDENRLLETYKAILRARDKYLSKEK